MEVSNYIGGGLGRFRSHQTFPWRRGGGGSCCLLWKFLFPHSPLKPFWHSDHFIWCTHLSFVQSSDLYVHHHDYHSQCCLLLLSTSPVTSTSLMICYILSHHSYIARYSHPISSFICSFSWWVLPFIYSRYDHSPLVLEAHFLYLLSRAPAVGSLMQGLWSLPPYYILFYILIPRHLIYSTFVVHSFDDLIPFDKWRPIHWLDDTLEALSPLGEHITSVLYLHLEALHWLTPVRYHCVWCYTFSSFIDSDTLIS